MPMTQESNVQHSRWIWYTYDISKANLNVFKQNVQ
jgi:hypothetical protein